MVAAATTSLPEVPHGERNWDYRYCWLRDSAFTLWSLYALGFDWEADDFFWFLADLAQRDDEVQVVYGVDGERDLSEQILEHLSGYDGARPVRVGNEAYTQRQHDVWGTMLQAIHIRLGSWQRLDDRMWRVVRRQVESALKYWREPDLGIWEVRGEPKHFTFSKLMCWSAVQRGTQAALARGEAALAKTWAEAADEIRDDILAHGVDERGVFTQHYDTKTLDASLLLLPDDRVPAPRGSARPGHHPGHRGRAHRGRPGRAVPARRDRRRAARGRGHVHDLLLPAGLGVLRDRRDPTGPGSCASGCCRWPARSTCTPRRSTRGPAAIWATSPRRSPTWP